NRTSGRTSRQCARASLSWRTPCSDTTPRLLATCRTRRISRRARSRGTPRLAKSRPEGRSFLSLKNEEGAEVRPPLPVEILVFLYFIASLLSCFFFISLVETPHNRAHDTAGTSLLPP